MMNSSATVITMFYALRPQITGSANYKCLLHSTTDWKSDAAETAIGGEGGEVRGVGKGGRALLG